MIVRFFDRLHGLKEVYELYAGSPVGPRVVENRYSYSFYSVARHARAHIIYSYTITVRDLKYFCLFFFRLVSHLAALVATRGVSVSLSLSSAGSGSLLIPLQLRDTAGFLFVPFPLHGTTLIKPGDGGSQDFTNFSSRTKTFFDFFKNFRITFVRPRNPCPEHISTVRGIEGDRTSFSTEFSNSS